MGRRPEHARGSVTQRPGHSPRPSWLLRRPLPLAAEEKRESIGSSEVACESSRGGASRGPAEWEGAGVGVLRRAAAGRASHSPPRGALGSVAAAPWDRLRSLFRSFTLSIWRLQGASRVLGLGRLWRRRPQGSGRVTDRAVRAVRCDPRRARQFWTVGTPSKVFVRPEFRGPGSLPKHTEEAASLNLKSSKRVIVGGKIDRSW